MKPSKFTYVPYLIILLLLCALFIERCMNKGGGKGQPFPTKPDIQVVHDTVFITKKGGGTSRPKVTGSKPLVKDSLQVPPCDSLVVQHFSETYYEDSLVLDSMGSVKVYDTLREGKLSGRSYTYDLKIPQVTTTITIREPYKPRRQLYLGGGLSANAMEGFTTGRVGLLYKNRRDQLFGGHLQTDMKGRLSYGVDTYWKLSFRK